MLRKELRLQKWRRKTLALSVVRDLELDMRFLTRLRRIQGMRSVRERGRQTGRGRVKIGVERLR